MGIMQLWIYKYCMFTFRNKIAYVLNVMVVYMRAESQWAEIIYVCES